MTKPRRAGATLVLLVGAAALLATGAIVAVAASEFSPPDDAPLATHDIQSGKPFEFEVVSNGKPLRVWLDMRCDRCALPVDGAIQLSANGKIYAPREISAGTRRTLDGDAHALEQHLLFDADERPKGEVTRVTGTLSVSGPKRWTGGRIEGAGGPDVHSLRLSISN